MRATGGGRRAVGVAISHPMAAVEACVMAWLAWGVGAGLRGWFGMVRGLFWVD